MTDDMFCANCLSQYQEILSKMRFFGPGKYSKVGRTLFGQFTLTEIIIRQVSVDGPLTWYWSLPWNLVNLGKRIHTVYVYSLYSFIQTSAKHLNSRS